jgi:hypothetical protein
MSANNYEVMTARPFKTEVASGKTIFIPAGISFRVAEQNDDRNAIGLINLSPTITAYIGTDPTVTSYPGLNPGYTLLPTGIAEDDTYVGELWIYADSAIVLSIWEE